MATFRWHINKQRSGLTFPEALEAIAAGARVRREGWEDSVEEEAVAKHAVDLGTIDLKLSDLNRERAHIQRAARGDSEHG